MAQGKIAKGKRVYSNGLLALVIFKGHPRNSQPAIVRAYESDGQSGFYHLLFLDGGEAKIMESKVRTYTAPTKLVSDFKIRYSPEEKNHREFNISLRELLEI